MQKKLTPLIFLFILFFALGSCTIERRHYLNGIYVDKRGKADIVSSDNDNGTAQLALKNVEERREDAKLCVDAGQEHKISSEVRSTPSCNPESKVLSGKRTEAFIDKSSVQNCDVVILKSGDEVECKIVEVTQEEIKYRKCSSQDGPIFTINKSDALVIKYADGTKTVLSEDQGNDPIASTKGGKSQLVAFILCFFFGLLGVHRFYLGYTAIGIIQLLTAGGCGIWALIDLILILTGDLKPAKGNYAEKF